MIKNQLNITILYFSQAVHWNTYGKVEGTAKLPEYFLNLYFSFLDYNGNLLRRELIGCPSLSNDKKVRNWLVK